MSKSWDETQFSERSIRYLETRPKSERSPLGQFLTPKSLRDSLVQMVQLKPGMRVLDPGVGTGEFLLSCQQLEPNLYLEGWDIDPIVADVARQLIPEAVIKTKSALEFESEESFDLVIGNPPYFEISNMDKTLRLKFQDVIGGRPNIFALFFKVGISLLKPGGQLAFVVPPSMNNGAFFSKLRSYILENASIETLRIFNDSKLFLDAQTAVQLIVLKKGKKGNRHTVDLGALGRSGSERIIFVENPKELEAEFESRTTLWNLGYEANTGTLVWNQHKENLCKKAEPGSVPLIWAHNITDAKYIVLDENHPKKLQHVKVKQSSVGPAIVLNRITGGVGQGNLKCALIPAGQMFIGENHVNVIRARKQVNQVVDWEKLLELLRSPGINQRVQRLTGNTQISSVELTHFLPLDYEHSDLFSERLF